jgi:extradiol dioxygenase family protein
MTTLTPFHLAIPVSDINRAREFYGGLLGCQEGRSDVQWVDFDFFGHQLVVHRVEAGVEPGVEPGLGQKPLPSNPVDGHDVPIPHFGVVLEWDRWQQLADKLTRRKLQFVIEPYVRFQGRVGEQATMFLLDPFGNALEFKAFRDPKDLFRKW